MKRRDFLRSGAAGVVLGGATRPLAQALGVSDMYEAVQSVRDGAEKVDRRARLARHAPVVRTFESFSALSVGNGGFAFTADATGLQTFPDDYGELPLATQAEWGWHSFPNPSGYSLKNAMVSYDAHGRPVPYASAQNGPAGAWLRENPHRLSLARIGFVLRRAEGSPARSADLTGVEQRLDLWTGTLESRFTLDGRAIRVSTCAHPAHDLLAVRVEG